MHYIETINVLAQTTKMYLLISPVSISLVTIRSSDKNQNKYEIGTSHNTFLTSLPT
jgi:hypothetical protein